MAVYDARFAQPVDAELIHALLSARVPVLTVEDHSEVGGFGAAVLASAHAQGLDTRQVVVRGLPQAWVGPDARVDQLAAAGLDAAGIGAALAGLLERAAGELIQAG